MAPPLVALWDTETNGLLRVSKDKTLATKMHCIAVKLSDGRIYCGADQPGYDGRIRPMTLPGGRILEGVKWCSIREALEALAEADIRVGHNSQDFDERIIRKFYPTWKPRPGTLNLCRDTLILFRLIYPVISKGGPNTHKLPPRLKNSYSLKALGIRLGEQKADFDAGDWSTWSQDMSAYMMQDVESLERAWKWAVSRKPSQQAIELEHDFAEIIRRQEVWGFTFDHDKALDLQADLHKRIRQLESDLIAHFGEWWEPGRQQVVKATRKVKLTGYPDVTLPRFNAKGQRLPKDYVGPPQCHYEQGAKFTPIKRVEFNPGSREHVRLKLGQLYGWKPKKFTDKGTPQIDDDILRALPYPEAEMLADYFAADKILGYVSKGKKAWLATAYEEADEFRQHGSVNTIGTYTFRPSMQDPNLGQVPTRDPTYGHRCRELFIARKRFRLMGFDGSSLQLRLLAHYLHRWDGGAYAKVVSEGDPHAFIRDLVGTDLMGEGDSGRGTGKTLNYTIVFGGGDTAVGRVVRPHIPEREIIALGQTIKERASDLFGPLAALKAALKERTEAKGTLIGLDGREATCYKAHAALALLLQMAEAAVMKTSLVILDRKLQAAGMRPGVDAAGIAHPDLADYEWCVNVYDEGQADVRPQWADTFRRLALEAVPEAGIRLGVKCPLKAEVKEGLSWKDTH